VEPGTFSQATTYEKDHGRRSAQRHFPQSSSASRRTAAASGYVKTVGRTLESRKDGARLVSEPPTPTPPPVMLDGLGFQRKPQEAMARPCALPRNGQRRPAFMQCSPDEADDDGRKLR
jgi:hypothetical protein